MCACEHHWDLNAPCTCSCLSHAGVRAEMDSRQTHTPAPVTGETTDAGVGERNCNHPCQGCWNGCHHNEDDASTPDADDASESDCRQCGQRLPHAGRSWREPGACRTSEAAASTGASEGLSEDERDYLRGLVIRECRHEGRTGRDWCCAACHDLAARVSAAATRAADDLLKVIREYFDLDADPWEDHDAACPAPEDLWRLHRDLKAAIARTTP